MGRGPLAGPVAVCAFKMPVDFDARKFGKIKDSKQLRPENREAIFGLLQVLKKDKKVDYVVAYESARRIDEIGISKALKNCIGSALRSIRAKPAECIIMLDGGLKANKKFKNQKTIIGGDAKERPIAFASIVAKVLRDRIMINMSKKYPAYNFHIHKGYGTKTHRDLILKFGPCPEHRKTFCKKLLTGHI